MFTWNVVFAIASVLLTFALGLGLALALKDQALKGKGFYRSIFILPYAIPGFLSILIWRGLLNDQFGKVNGMIEVVGLNGVDWLGSPVWAMVSVILVNLWLGFPYMFLISSGALTSVPEDLLEAARVDGAGAWKQFRMITLPLLLVSTAPLLIGCVRLQLQQLRARVPAHRRGPPARRLRRPGGSHRPAHLVHLQPRLRGGAGEPVRARLGDRRDHLRGAGRRRRPTSFRLTKRLEECYG